jgi:adenine-specific DNA-methyltransferase
VTGPFTVEAVPAPTVRPMTDAGAPPAADASVARSGETQRQAEWRAELLRTGIRGKGNQMILFARVEPLAGTRWLHADGETLPDARGGDSVRERAPGERIVVSFGPEHQPLEQRQVELAWAEARTLAPRPGLLVFAALPFEAGVHRRVAVKIVDDRGIESLKVIAMP